MKKQERRVAKIVCAAIGHKWGAWLRPHNPRYFGEDHRQCQRCGLTERRKHEPNDRA